MIASQIPQRKGPPEAPAISLPEEGSRPTRWQAAWFRFRAVCFQARRRVRDLFDRRLRRYERGLEAEVGATVGMWQSELWSEAGRAAERQLQLGKVQNLRAAAARLDGVEVPAGATFSFWKQVGRATRGSGFAVGRELREGCLIPTLGGGLCQLSGAMHSAAVEAGLEIVERHAHTDRAVSTLSRIGRDATVFWNYVDLRLRADFAWRLEVRLTMDRLVVKIVSLAKEPGRNGAVGDVEPASAPAPGACDSCGVTACFRHLGGGGAANGVDRIAVLVDEFWPEFDEYLASFRTERATLFRPLDGRAWRKANYAWSASGYGETRSALWTTLRRAWATRRLREQGAERQRALLAWDELLARGYARRLRAEHSHVIVSQNLLPFLWRDGVLGGRTFDVLMVRLPLADLQRALDRGAQLHPESKTCGDFRAPEWMVAAEAEALEAAGGWITPHSGIARLAGEKAIHLPWKLPAPAVADAPRGTRVVFPASTLCRKGAYELRAAGRALKVAIWCAGGMLEGAGFWNEGEATRIEGDWMEDAAVVVLPAFVEHRPRRLLAALARGVSVTATPECGLGGLAGVREVPAGDEAALTTALREALELERPEPAPRR